MKPTFSSPLLLVVAVLAVSEGVAFQNKAELPRTAEAQQSVQELPN